MDEIEALEAAVRAAQARLGVAAGLLARDEWFSVSMNNPSGSGTSWLRRILRMILGLRFLSRDLAEKSYRVARAVQTRKSFKGSDASTLDELRDELENQLKAIQSLDFRVDGSTDPNVHWVVELMRSAASDDPDAWASGELDEALKAWVDARGGDATVDVDDLVFPGDSIFTFKQVEAAFAQFLDDAGLADLEQKMRVLQRKYADDPDRLLAEIENAYLVAQSKVASVVDKAVMDGGREATHAMVHRDRRVKQMARGVRANPCYFCAMLASRGFDYEVTEVIQYHPNCHCYPIIRWVNDEPMPAANKYYHDLWNEHIAGVHSSGKARNEWRKLLNRLRKRGT